MVTNILNTFLKSKFIIINQSINPWLWKHIEQSRQNVPFFLIQEFTYDFHYFDPTTLKIHSNFIMKTKLISCFLIIGKLMSSNVIHLSYMKQ
jgi:hypothetical protein